MRHMHLVATHLQMVLNNALRHCFAASQLVIGMNLAERLHPLT